MCAEEVLSLAQLEMVESVDLEESIILGIAESVALMSVMLSGDSSGGTKIFAFDGLEVEVAERDPHQGPAGRMRDVFAASNNLLEMKKDISLVAVFAGLLVADGWSMLAGKVRSPSWMLDHDERDVGKVAEEYGVCAEKFTLEMLSALSMA